MKVSPVARTILGLGFTQIVGWGTTFLMPSVLGRRMEDALGIPSEIVFSGITVMFAVGAILAPRIGRLIDRTGARIELSAHDFPARVIQHETDHLDGVLFFDRMRSLDSMTFLDEYSRFWRKTTDD